MNEKLQYATMLEIPVNTCNITYKPAKKRGRLKRRAKTPEAVKEELLHKVNAESERETNVAAATGEPVSDARDAVPTAPEYSDNYSEESPLETAEDTLSEIADTNENEREFVSASVHSKRRKPLFKFTAVTAELIAIVALVATIFLTNAFYVDSAINVFMRKVFAPQTQATSEKNYDDFAPVINFGGALSVENGVISYSASGAVYAPCNGTVSAISESEDGTYTMTIAHSGVFSSAISGLKYAYLNEGDAVYGTIPVGYAKDTGITMCFISNGTVITDYTVENNAVLWAV